jgi:hypothetical protein
MSAVLRRTFALLALPIVATIVISGPASAATATPLPSGNHTVLVAPTAAGQGIIMRDGGICDPIRHMGC